MKDATTHYLDNSLWSFEYEGTITGPDAVRFASGGRAILGYPDGSIDKGTWAIHPGGYFVLQTSAAALCYGTIIEEAGTGQMCDPELMRCTFTMKKES